METAISKFENALNKHTCLSTSGITQNVQRYVTVPTDNRPNDVQRCELTRNSYFELGKIVRTIVSKKKQCMMETSRHADMLKKMPAKTD